MTDAYQTSGNSPTLPVMNYEPLLNDEEAAVFLGGLHPKTVQRMARRGGIPTTVWESITAIVLVSFQHGLCYIHQARFTRLLLTERRFNEQAISNRLPIPRITKSWPGCLGVSLS